MDKINQQHNWVSMNAKSKEDVIIDANLELIDELAKRLSNSEDKIFVDKIISTIKEIVEIQRSVIKELKESKKRLTADDIPWAEDEIDKSESFISEKTLNSFMPLYGNGFETDKQVIKAFSNYLQYHNVKKLSKLTAYDYCSRVKNLWEPFFKDWQSGALEGIIQFSNEGVLPNSPLLNVYNNFHVIFRYVDYKIKLQEKGTPAFKNLANASAALNKFLEFRSMVQNNK